MGKSPREPLWGVSRQGWPASASPPQPPSSSSEDSEEGSEEEGSDAEGSEEGAVKRGAVRRGMGKMMVMILELRKRLEDNQCQLMYNVQWMTEFSRTRLSMIFLSALGQKLC